MSQPTDTDSFFNALLQSMSDEAYLIDAKHLRLVIASHSVYKKFHLTLDELQKKNLQQLIDVNEKEWVELINAHQHLSKTDNPSKGLPSTAKFYTSGALSCSLISIDDHQYLLIVKGLSSIKAQALDESESRFKALVTNTPGLVFEFQLDDRGDILFGYLSDGCNALLGIDPEKLRESPKNFFKMIDKSDKALLKRSIKASAANLKMLNWEGRVWIEAWQDTKWVNLRAIPRTKADGATQWEGIMTNITQSKKEKYELEQSRQRLAELSAHLTKVKEEERSRIAREIHDDLGGNLTAIKIGLASILKRLADDQPALIEKTKNLESIVDNTFEAAHRISGDLRPTILELGIVAALEWQTKAFEKQMEIPCYFTTNQLDADETKDQAITLFRICQEAMSNIAKYANAQRVDVAIFFSKNDIRMYVTDDGIGIHASDMLKPNSFGLRGMAERVAALKGHFFIEKVSDKGTNITVILPRQVADGV